MVATAIAKLETYPQVTKLRSPFAKGNEGQVSEDGHSALIQYSPKGTYDEATAVHRHDRRPAPRQVQKANPDYTVVEAGSASTGKALDAMFTSQLARAGMISIPITLVILLLVFGSLVGAFVPLGLALTAVFATMGLVALPSQIVPMDESVSEVILLIGLAVGVDYTLFYIRRERDERRAGRSETAALEAAAATSGRAVLISGITVMIAMAGMFFSGDKTFMSFAIGTMMVVAVAMIGSLTVLPAVLAWLGDRVDKARVPFLARLKRDDGESRLWGAILGAVLRRPLVSALGATAVLLVLAAPALKLHTSQSGFDALPASMKEVQSFNKVRAAFPGGATPAVVAIKGDAADPQLLAAVADLKQEALASGKALEPFYTDVSPDGTVLRVAVPLVGSGTDTVSNGALDTLRNEILPATVGKVPGVQYAVTGDTAGSKDWNDKMKSSAPLVFAFVLSFAFLLLLVSFHSIVIPIKAIVMNLLSVGAAYGLLVADLPVGLGIERAGLPEERRHRLLAADVPLRDPVRALDGLPRVHPEPRQGVLRPRDEHRPGRRGGHPLHSLRRHERGRRDGVRLRRVLADADHRHEGDGDRPRGRRPDRRHDRPGGAAARDDEAPGRLELVPPPVARLAADPRARDRRRPGHRRTAGARCRLITARPARRGPRPAPGPSFVLAPAGGGRAAGEPRSRSPGKPQRRAQLRWGRCAGVAQLVRAPLL